MYKGVSFANKVAHHPKAVVHLRLSAVECSTVLPPPSAVTESIFSEKQGECPKTHTDLYPFVQRCHSLLHLWLISVRVVSSMFHFCSYIRNCRVRVSVALPRVRASDRYRSWGGGGYYGGGGGGYGR